MSAFGLLPVTFEALPSRSDVNDQFNCAPLAETCLTVSLYPLPAGSMSVSELFGAPPELYLLFARFNVHVPTNGSFDWAATNVAATAMPTTPRLRRARGVIGPPE